MSSEQAGGTPGSGAMSERMRALLSRAAQEQLVEQRQVSAVLVELRALVEDVDERLATGEQVERVGAEVRALSARVEARLDAAEARSAELAERISGATALLGRAAQDLVEAVAAGVAERVEAQLREVTTSLTASAETRERRLATHVDDAVLALAEVVLRRRSAQGVPAVAPPVLGHEGRPPRSAAEPAPSDPPQAEDGPSDVPSAEGDPVAPAAVDLPAGPPVKAPPSPGEDGAAPPLLVDPATDGLVPAPGEAPPGDGFVLVPADVEEPDAGPAPPVQSERRTAERRTSERGDGSGRRRRPWWRPV